MTTPRQTGVKRRAEEAPADAAEGEPRKTFRQHGDAVLVKIDEVMRGDDSRRFEEARARAAQALEQYEKAAEKCEEHGSLCGDCREFFDETIVAALRMKNRVLVLELEDLKKRHAAEIQALKCEHEREDGDLRVQMNEFKIELRELKAQFQQTMDAVSRAHAETSKPPGLEEGPAPAK